MPCKFKSEIRPHIAVRDFFKIKMEKRVVVLFTKTVHMSFIFSLTQFSKLMIVRPPVLVLVIRIDADCTTMILVHIRSECRYCKIIMFIYIIIILLSLI